MTIAPLTEPALLRLLQLVSPALPVGSFAYSRGLESAVELGSVRDEETALRWIGGLFLHSFSRLDLPVLFRLREAWLRGDPASARRWSTFLLASRESKELLLEDTGLGSSLARVLAHHEIHEAAEWVGKPFASQAALFALAATHWEIPWRSAASGYSYAYCETQVIAATRLLPLGQTAMQRLLSELIAAVPKGVDIASELDDDDVGSFAPGLAIASARHETQYSRLFRS